jgi:3-oxoadipate enol-lactonase
VSLDVRKRLQGMMALTSVAGVVGALEAMRDRPDSPPLLHSLAGTQTLLLIGEYDARTPRASMQDMADRIPGARFEVIPNAGHVLPLERAGETTRRFRRFLDELPELGCVGLVVRNDPPATP